MIKAIWTMDKNGLIGKKKDFLEKIERKCFILNLQWRIKRLFGDRTYFSTTGNFGNSKVYIVTNNVDLKIEKENVEIIKLG